MRPDRSGEEGERAPPPGEKVLVGGLALVLVGGLVLSGARRVRRMSSGAGAGADMAKKTATVTATVAVNYSEGGELCT